MAESQRLEDTQVSQAGIPWRCGLPVDDGGHALPVVFYDQNATETLPAGQEICCFWAESKKALHREGEEAEDPEEESTHGTPVVGTISRHKGK